MMVSGWQEVLTGSFLCYIISTAYSADLTRPQNASSWSLCGELGGEYMHGPDSPGSSFSACRSSCGKGPTPLSFIKETPVALSEVARLLWLVRVLSPHLAELGCVSQMEASVI